MMVPMPRYIAFLRAVNVGGRFLKMATLAQHFEALGYPQVQTFINSGNVIFRAPSRSGVALAKSLEAGLEPLLGFKSDVFLRTESELRLLTQQGLSLTDQVGPNGEVNVAFLAQALTLEQHTALDSLRSEVDAFHCAQREVYWLCQCGQSESKFSNAQFERKLRTRTTFRRVSMLKRLVSELET